MKPFLLTAVLLSLSFAPVAMADYGESVGWPTSASLTFGTSHNVPSSVAARYVTLTLKVSATTLEPGEVTADRCSSSTTFANHFVVANGGTVQSTMTLAIPGDTCYRINNAQDPAARNTIIFHVYFDVMKESFEGRSHANATRLDMNTTRTEQNDIQNATRTAQNDIQNATRTAQNDIQNATFLSGDFVGNLWFNNSWRWSPTLGNITALSLNTTEFGVLGNVTTQIDFAPSFLPWVWLGITLLMLYWGSFFPAFVAFLAFGNSFLPSPRWINAASFMLFGIAVMIEYLMRRWPQEVKRYLGISKEGR